MTDQKSLSISYLQTDYLNLDRSSDKNNERSNLVQVKLFFCGGSHPIEIKKSKEKIRITLARLVIRTYNELNTHIANVLDADLRII